MNREIAAGTGTASGAGPATTMSANVPRSEMAGGPCGGQLGGGQLEGFGQPVGENGSEARRIVERPTLGEKGCAVEQLGGIAQPVR